MGDKNFALALLIVFFTAGFFKVAETQAETTHGKFSSEPFSPRTYNPFSLEYWLNLPSRFVQYWFPMFQPQYYPSNLKPTTTMRPTVVTQKPTEDLIQDSKPNTSNIFGISKLPDDTDVEYLPSENDIEW